MQLQLCSHSKKATSFSFRQMYIWLIFLFCMSILKMMVILVAIFTPSVYMIIYDLLTEL